MTIVIGTDEAGYGPNLGPLLIGASVWHVPDDLDPTTLYTHLSDSASKAPGDDQHRWPVADSKELYHPGGGWSLLERGVYTALVASGQLNRLAALPVGGPMTIESESAPADGLAHLTWRGVWEMLSPNSLPALDRLPWYREFDTRLPRDASHVHIEEAARRLALTLDETGIQLIHVECDALFPERFNDAVDTQGGKGAALSCATMDLVARLWQETFSGARLICCDKHGGRNRYGPLLQERFPDYLVEVYEESTPSSIYKWGPADNRAEFRFVAGGERFLPTALASMAAKYTRELAMNAFNAFWRELLPDLKPTAGYPQDAKRFRREIEVTRKKLGVADRLLWRSR